MKHLPTRVYHIILFLSIAGAVLFGFFYHAQGESKQVAGIPETLEGAWSLIWRGAQGIPSAVLEAFRAAWDTMSVMLGWVWTQLQTYVVPQINDWASAIWQKFLALLGMEIEKRKPIIEQELEKEKQEIIGEAQGQAEKAGKGLWERFKALIKENL